MMYDVHNMRMRTIKLLGGLCVGLLGTELIWQLWKNFRHNRKKSILTKTEIINEVLIFSDDFIHCRNHANSRISCSNKCPVANIKRLIFYLNTSFETLDICMYIMTCQDVTNAIVEAHRRNIVVRVIVDANMFENGGCYEQVERMKRNGVRVRMQRSNTSLMHHKFALIDGKIMIYGSTNWTMQAFFGNFDAILVTNQRQFVTVFSNEFNRMWKIMQ